MKTSGLDVHKETIFCAIYGDDSPKKKSKHEVKEFQSLTCEIKRMGNYLQEAGVKRVAMESTGIYWIPVWNILEHMGFELMLVNPYLVKALPGKKSDVKDSERIAELLHKGLLQGSLIPDEHIRALRSYGRKYKKLQVKQTICVQEMEKILIMCNIRISSFVSNINSKSMIRVIENIISGEDNPEKLAELIHGRILKKGKDKIIASLQGFVCDHHRDLLSLSLEEYKMYLHQEEECIKQMKKLGSEYYQQDIDLLKTIPGVSDISAIIILAETGGDMNAFEKSSKISGWAGLRPRNDESAGKYKSRAITKGNQYLRTILVQISWASIRVKGSYFKEKYQKLVVRKPYNKALIAIARKMLVVIWNILKERKAFNPELLPIYDPIRLESKLKYHKKEFEKVQALLDK